MNLIRTASVALVLGLAVATSASPASAFFFCHKDKVAAATTSHPIHAFFAAIFHCKK